MTVAQHIETGSEAITFVITSSFCGALKTDKWNWLPLFFFLWNDFLGWRPAVTVLYVFLFHSLLPLTSFLSQNKSQFLFLFGSWSEQGREASCRVPTCKATPRSSNTGTRTGRIEENPAACWGKGRRKPVVSPKNYYCALLESFSI